ncbi:MAG TPA: hypothetical protein VFZ32_02485 [Micromonosporaceae bacterium]|jgi:hypothetical protein
MKAAMVTTFGQAFPGREKAAVKYSHEVEEFFTKKAAEGMFTEPKTFFAPTGKSFWFIEGEYDALVKLLATPETEKFLTIGKLLFQDFGYGLYVTDYEEMMRRYEWALRELELS